MTSVAAQALAAEGVAVPDGAGERFAGYGVMGLPFASGHVLAMRRFPASSVGPGYTSVWHRSPAGTWTFWQDQAADLGCGRYFSDAVADVVRAEVELSWPARDELHVVVPSAALDWRMTLRGTARTRTFNALGSVLPDRAWRSARLLRAMGPLAGRALGAGPVVLAGEAPNGQPFVANPQRLWFVDSVRATLGGVDLGPAGRLRRQATLGGFAIPQRGVFALGRAFFDAAHDG